MLFVTTEAMASDGSIKADAVQSNFFRFMIFLLILMLVGRLQDSNCGGNAPPANDLSKEHARYANILNLNSKYNDLEKSCFL